MTAARMKAPFDTIGELLHALGDIPPDRVRLNPVPGTATVKDLVRLNDRKERLYELVDGTLVEKTMGYNEGFLAQDIAFFLQQFVRAHDLGDVGGADSTMRLMSGLVRLPDISFVRWERYANRRRPSAAVPDIAPDLAVEVLSRKNTRGEMARKRKEYFLAGTKLVWQVDPRKRTVEVFTAPDSGVTLTEKDTLDGGDVLPGFSVPVAEVFARVPNATPGKRSKK